MYKRNTFSLFVIFLMATLPAHAAFTCPPMPTAVTSVNRDIKSDISASVGLLGKIKTGEIAAKTDVVAKNLFEKYPNVDKLLALQTMSATYCEMLKSTTAISEIVKLDRWEKFQDKVLDLKSNPQMPTKQPRSTSRTSATDSSTPKISDKPEGTKSSLVGSWVGSPSCLVVFYKDDGKDVEGSCDVGGYRHKVSGRYDDLTNIGVTITRTDPNGCVTSVRGFIRIVSRDSVEMGQNGWNGCGVTTESVATSLSRGNN